ELPGTQQRDQCIAPLGSYREIVLENDALTVEEKALALRRRIVEQFIDQRNEALTKTAGRVVPLAIPVSVGYYVDGKQRVRAEGLGPRAEGRLMVARLRATACVTCTILQNTTESTRAKIARADSIARCLSPVQASRFSTPDACVTPPVVVQSRAAR